MKNLAAKTKLFSSEKLAREKSLILEDLRTSLRGSSAKSFHCKQSFFNLMFSIQFLWNKTTNTSICSRTLQLSSFAPEKSFWKLGKFPSCRKVSFNSPRICSSIQAFVKHEFLRIEVWCNSRNWLNLKFFKSCFNYCRIFKFKFLHNAASFILSDVVPLNTLHKFPPVCNRIANSEVSRWHSISNKSFAKAWSFCLQLKVCGNSNLFLLGKLLFVHKLQSRHQIYDKALNLLQK